MKLRTALSVACAGLMAVPAIAQAAGTVAIGGDAVNFQAAPGVANDVTMTATAQSVTVTDAAEVINEGDANCAGNGTNTVTCTQAGLTEARAMLEDMNDRLRGTGTLRVLVQGGAGDDDLTVLNEAPRVPGLTTFVLGDEGNDRITTGEGDEGANGGPGTDSIAMGGGNDSADGGPGDGDTVDLGAGNDSVFFLINDGVGEAYVGGPGLDEVDVLRSGSVVPAELVVDLAAGTVAENGVALASAVGFEDAFASGYANTNVRGTSGSNAIETANDINTVDPGAGSDFVSLGVGADRALVRDGFADFVRCGPGVDSAEVDQLDSVIDCENVSLAQVRPAGARLGPPGCEISSVRSRVRRSVLIKRGLRAAVSCAQPATVEVRLLARAAPRRGVLGLARAGDVVLAERALPLAAGRRTVRLRVTRRLRKAIPRSARLRLQVVARDEFGNVQIVTKRVRVTSPIRAR